MNLDQLQSLCLEFLEGVMASDPAHDITHVKRVVQNTLMLTQTENGNTAISLPAAWLHDCVSVAKSSPLRKQASKLAADEGVRFLESINYPEDLLAPIYHAIEAHSFSANIATKTLEARIVQDADRLEALGAIGIARCLLTGGSMGTPLYEPSDPFAANRDLIQSGENGILVPALDRVPAYAAGLEQLMSNEDLRVQMGLNARQSARRFERTPIMESWMGLIENCAARAM